VLGFIEGERSDLKKLLLHIVDFNGGHSSTSNAS
jgi:hypothetical protein